MKFLFNSSTGNGTVIDHLTGAIPEKDRVEIAVGYIDINGLAMLRDFVKDLISRGGTFRLVIGMHGHKGGISFEELKMLWDLNNFSRHDTEEERVKLLRERPYHGKIYLLSKDTGYELVIGSSNLSAPGLKYRREANVIIEGNQSDENYTQIIENFEQLWQDATPISEQSILIITLPRTASVIDDEEVRPLVVEESHDFQNLDRYQKVEFVLTENNLNEGGRPRVNEAYLNAGSREKNIFFGGKGHIFQVITDDKHTFQASITGYGDDPEIGKNLRSTPSNKSMAEWLKLRKSAQTGDKVIAYKLPSENTYFFKHEPA